MIAEIGIEQINLLKRLCQAIAVSGDEGEVRRIVLDEIRPYSDDVRVDVLGNVLASRFGSDPNRLRVMLAAHMDEIGFMITSQDGDGIYRFETIGGQDVRQLPGKNVWVGKQNLPGVIGVRPIHLLDDDEYIRQIPLESLRIDLGPGGGSVQPGDRATYAPYFQEAGPSIFAKALDNRLGVTTLIELFKHAPSNIDLLAAFTVQEEIGMRGAKVATRTLQPDLAIAIDSTPALDLPAPDGRENEVYNTLLDCGPALYTVDNRTLSDPRLTRFLAETARLENIPFQYRQPGGGGTDAGAIHQQLAGVPAVTVSVPGRYAHSAVSLCRLDDWRHTLQLLQAALCRLTPDLLAGERR